MSRDDAMDDVGQIRLDSLVVDDADLARGSPDQRLAVLGAAIRGVWAEAKGHQVAAIEGYLRVGRLLTAAREEFTSDRAYGTWFREQAFGFSTEWGRRMRLVAAHPVEVANVVASALASGAALPGLDRLIEYIEHLGVRGWWDPATVHTGPLTPPSTASRDPRTTSELLARVTAYSADVRELLRPGAAYVARQIAATGDPWADAPGSTTSTDHLREQAAALRDLAEAVDDLASRIEGAADPTAGHPGSGDGGRRAPARQRRSPRSG